MSPLLNPKRTLNRLELDHSPTQQPKHAVRYFPNHILGALVTGGLQMATQITRRDLGTTAGSLALGLAASPTATAQAQVPQTNFVQPSAPRFPDGFYWGVATASYQIEGAWNEDAKGPSIWDTYAHTPGKIKNGDTGDVAIDHYHRYKEDVQVMKEIGANAYRFSISWPRIFPEGTGQINQKGLDFYNRLVDELKAAGIEPFATLYHWDLPQALQDRYGGWQSAETAKALGEYASAVAKSLSDRVSHFFTINEFKQVTETAYRGVELHVQGKTVRLMGAPGILLEDGPLNQVRHHAVLGHGMAVQAVRANGRAGTKVGPAENLGHAIPIIDSPEHVKAAVAATKALNVYFLGPILEGRYDEAYLKSGGNNAPKFTDAEMKIIGSPVDFVGINVYIPLLVVKASDKSPGYEETPFSLSHPKMFSAWHRLVPESQYWSPRLLHEIWRPKEIYITENGCAGDDTVAADGQINDTDRLTYLRNGLMWQQRATTEGIPLKGNFYWSSMDNFEWINGYGDRFGLVHVDFKTQKRTPKLSAEWFGKLPDAMRWCSWYSHHVMSAFGP
jgi:beta-glucosidase